MRSPKSPKGLKSPKVPIHINKVKKPKVSNVKLVIYLVIVVVILILIGIAIYAIVNYFTKSGSTHTIPFLTTTTTQLNTSTLPTTTIPSQPTTTTTTTTTQPTTTTTTTTQPTTTTTTTQPSGKCQPIPQPTYHNVPADINITSNGWEGWATTTEFGSGDGVWPGGNISLDIAKIMDWGKQANTQLGTITYKTGATTEQVPVYGSMGVAIPWPILLNTYAGRTEFITDVVDSCMGRNNSPCCFIIQPIQKFPTEVKNKGDNHNTDVSGGSGASLNDPNIAATHDSGQPFPAYFCIPYEGCGGNCNLKTGVGDCFNSCKDIQNVVLKSDYFSTISGQPDNTCLAAYMMWNKSNPNYSYYPALDNDLVNANYDPAAISSYTNYGLGISACSKNPNCSKDGFVNYCTGKNMHFDVAQDNPLWTMPHDGVKFTPDNGHVINITAGQREGDMTNTMVRFIRVPGSIFGAFDVSGGGGASCGINAYETAGGCGDNIPSFYSGDCSKMCCCNYGLIPKPDRSGCIQK